VKFLSESFTVKCPSCGESIELTIRKVSTKLSVAIVEEAIKEWVDQVEIIESDDCISVVPKEFLGKQLWYQVNNALEKLGAEWISAGKESKWIIKKA
jgi:uncharacterized Zn finger protein